MARKRKKTDGPSVVAAGGVHPDVARFASYVRDDEQRARRAKQAAREARRQAEETERLVAAKDAAAAEVKRLRARTGVSAEARAAADAAYRDALAAVLAAETGQPPAWASAAPGDDHAVHPAADVPEPQEGPADPQEPPESDTAGPEGGGSGTPVDV